MDLQKRNVDKIPLEEIWNQSEIVSKVRLKYLTSEEIRSLLKQGKVQFVVANIGFPLDWIYADKSFDFFKTKLKNKIADEEANYLEDFPRNDFFYASICKSDGETPIVLLEMYH
jgi:kynurenine formamidase